MVSQSIVDADNWGVVNPTASAGDRVQESQPSMENANHEHHLAEIDIQATQKHRIQSWAGYFSRKAMSRSTSL